MELVTTVLMSMMAIISRSSRQYCWLSSMLAGSSAALAFSPTLSKVIDRRAASYTRVLPRQNSNLFSTISGRETTPDAAVPVVTPPRKFVADPFQVGMMGKTLR